MNEVLLLNCRPPRYHGQGKRRLMDHAQSCSHRNCMLTLKYGYLLSNSVFPFLRYYCRLLKCMPSHVLAPGLNFCTLVGTRYIAAHSVRCRLST